LSFKSQAEAGASGQSAYFQSDIWHAIGQYRPHVIADEENAL